MQVYLAASIAGGNERQEIVEGLLRFLQERGHSVLNWFVGVPEGKDAFRENAGLSQEEWDALSPVERRQLGFDLEMGWVEVAECFIAEVSARGSYGVGGEIHHAFLKPRLGLPVTPILCLYHQDGGEPTSTWIRGRKAESVWLRSYTSLFDAERIIKEFFKAFCLEE